MKKHLIKLFSLLLWGGFIYYIIELMWRGHSHPSMFLVGGLCFVLIGGINNYLPWSLGIVQQSLIGAVIITVVELVAGLVVNVWLGLGVWDYSGLPLNFMGQISLLFFVLWIPLATVGIFIDDWLRYKLFGEEKPHYTIF
ncbi:MAG: putative ABC transporter permease [Defluviitaleaceae bacterium]|nr:putative ABC transporter permease [Defluviitaleaceae bacterium]